MDLRQRKDEALASVQRALEELNVQLADWRRFDAQNASPASGLSEIQERTRKNLDELVRQVREWKRWSDASTEPTA